MTPPAERVRAISQRAVILALVKERPGLTMTEVVTTCEVPWSSAQRRLKELEDQGLVRSEYVAARRLLYPAEAAKEAPSPNRAHLVRRDSRTRAIAEAIDNSPGFGPEEISASTGISLRVVYHHLLRIKQAGLILSESETRYRGLVASAELIELLAQLRSA